MDKRKFSYNILLIDNDAPITFKPRCPETGTEIATTVINKIDDALLELRITPDLLGPRINELTIEPKHSYDIVLLDFEMDENKVEVNRELLERLATEPDPNKREQLLVNELPQLFRLEYPLGALTLLPLYKLAFDRLKRGECIIQGYSKVMWDRCPKAAAVFVLINNIGIKGDKATIEPSNYEGLPIGTLLGRRARSILQEAPADHLVELLDLLDCDKDNFWSRSLGRMADWLDCDNITFKDLRPDLEDHKEAREWLRSVLRDRSYAHEAKRCWLNPLVQEVGHNLNLAQEKLRHPSYEVYKWPGNDQIATVGGETFRVCQELWDELKTFPSLITLTPDERYKRMHRMFRMDLSSNKVQGYLLEEFLQGLPQDDPYTAALSPLDNLKLTRSGTGWGKNYLWVHRKVLYTLLKGFIQVPRFEEKDPNVLCHASASKSALYFIAFQNSDICENDKQRIFYRAKQALSEEKWGPFPELNDWGRMELWCSEGHFQLTSFGHGTLKKNNTVTEDDEIKQPFADAHSAVVMVIPLDVDAGF